MSSHREAPEISKDPVADSTDVYAFVSPDQPETVTLIANYIPLEAPAGASPVKLACINRVKGLFAAGGAATLQPVSSLASAMTSAWV